MAVTFVLGRAGAGKTHHCLDAALANLACPNEHGRLILLVPEQASLQMERALVGRTLRQVYARAEVLSFTRLAQRVFGELGPEPNLLGAHARVLALRTVVARLPDTWRAFRAAAHTNGFFTQLDRVIEELLRENVSPAEFAAAVAHLEEADAQARAAEIARVYAAYVGWLGRERVDPAARLAVLRERLAASEWLCDTRLWVDGFAGFTGQELATLVTLASGARETTITLLLDPAAPAVAPGNRPDPLHLFYHTESTYQRLMTLFDQAGIACHPPLRLTPARPPRQRNTAMLARLEAGLATEHEEPPRSTTTGASDASAVRVLACPTHRDELRQAARFIRQQVVESAGGLRCRDFALIARDLEPFADTVVEVFAEYGLPCFIDRRRPLRAHPLSRGVLALLDVATTDFAAAATTRLLRTGLLPLSRAQRECLENLIAGHEIRGAGLWRRPRWDFAGDSQLGASHGADPSGCVAESPELAGARQRIVAALTPLLELAHADKPPAGATWARALHGVAANLQFADCVNGWIAAARDTHAWESAELHRLAWDAFCELLENLHNVLGETPITAGELAAVSGSILGEQTLGLAPPTLDQVLVASIERSRHPEIKHAWVFAFNEGIFPAPPPDDCLLTTTDRDRLSASGLPAPRAHRDAAFDERLLAYIALTRASTSLTISYATTSTTGYPLQPSPLLGALLRVLPEVEVATPTEHEPPVCLNELVRRYLSVRQGDAPPQRVQALYEKLCQLLRSNDTGAARLAWLLRGTTYRNQPAAVGNFRRPRDTEPKLIWRASPSEIESYLRCPFQHFCSYGLGLEPRRGPQPVTWDLGSSAHDILARVTRRALAEPGSVRAISDKRWQELLSAARSDFEANLPDDLGERRPQVAFLCSMLGSILKDVVAVHADRWRRGTFEPLLLEHGFGRAGPEPALPPLALSAATGQRVEIHGQIDRVDICRVGDDAFVLVYDYKSSAEAFTGDYLSEKQLQLLLYLAALQTGAIHGQNVHLAGVLQAPLYPRLDALDPQYAANADPRHQRMYMFLPRGVFSERVAPLLDAQLGHAASPVAQMKLKKDGGFYKNSDAQPAAELAARLELARETVFYAAEGIAAGNIAVAPLLQKKRLACQYCEYRPVCRFDRLLNTPRPAEHTLPTLAKAAAPEQGAPSCN
ncbi:MAG: exodeoxyribonuclease V subunit gamma [Planctomycetes bacterium]|nr:exodeoxyribonuclease V subunit gamma [Planctomycetota bacterium]